MRASEQDMELLHGALCSYFLKLIDGRIPEMVEKTVEAQDDDGNKTYTKTWIESGLMVRPGAGDLAVMAKFLKDNAITGAAADDGDLAELEKKLAERHQRRGKLPTSRDVQDALRELGHNLVQ